MRSEDLLLDRACHSKADVSALQRCGCCCVVGVFGKGGGGTLSGGGGTGHVDVRRDFGYVRQDGHPVARDLNKTTVYGYVVDFPVGCVHLDAFRQENAQEGDVTGLKGDVTVAGAHQDHLSGG